MIKFTLFTFILSVINSQILNDANGSVGEASHGATANAAGISGGLPEALPFFPFGGSGGGAVAVPAGGVGGFGSGNSEGNTNTHADAGLIQLVFSGTDSSLAHIPVFSNEGSFGDDPFFN